MSDSVLSAVSLKKHFRSGERLIDVLRDVSLEVKAGESVSIRGESGSGKSTLLNILAGLDTADAGHLAWGGAPALASRRARFLGIVFQSFYLIPEIDAFQNVLMSARILSGAGQVEKKRARDLLDKVGLAERVDYMTNKLSGGERQRVAVARALMNSPKLLLADEPTGNLDEQTGDAVIEMLLELCRETQTALVLVTHNASHAAKTQRQLFLREGVLHAT